MDNRDRALVAAWQRRLGLDGWLVELERVSTFQVCDELCRVGNSLVGVVCDHGRREATIFHTRRLCRADIVHELLHVRHPDWTEAEVNEATRDLLGDRIGKREELCDGDPVLRREDAPEDRRAHLAGA